VRTALRDRQDALSELIEAIRKYRKLAEKTPLTLQGSDFAQAVEELNKAIDEEGEDPFAMFCDLKQKYNWVLDLLIYDCCANLVTALDKGLIAPALEKRREIALKKAQAMPTRHVREYL
jgi:hypothetical protein